MLSITEASLIVNLASHDQFTWRAMAITCKQINGVLSRYDMYDFIGGAVLLIIPDWDYISSYQSNDSMLLHRSHMAIIKNINMLHRHEYMIIYDWAQIRSRSSVVTPYCELSKDICKCHKYHKMWNIKRDILTNNTIVRIINVCGNITTLITVGEWVISEFKYKDISILQQTQEYIDSYIAHISLLPQDNYIADIISRKYIPI